MKHLIGISHENGGQMQVELIKVYLGFFRERVPTSLPLQTS
jgi:hypothetical protein